MNGSMKEAAMSALRSKFRLTLIAPVLLGACLALSAGCYLGDFGGDYKYKESFSKTLPLPAAAHIVAKRRFANFGCVL